MTKQEKIACHVTSVHSRYDVRIFQKECRSLANAGYKVYLIVCDDKADEIKDGVHILSTGFKPKNRKERFAKAGRAVLKLALQTGADLYHLHDPELLLIARKLNKEGKHVVFDSHEFYYYQIKQKGYIPQGLRNCIAGSYKLYEKRVLSEIDAVITPCTINGKNYFDSIAKKTVLINNLPWSNAYTSVNYFDKPQPPICCCPGSLTVDRGLVEIVKCSIKTDTKVILAGDLSDSCKRLLGNHLSNALVDFRGRVDPNGIQSIYDEASIGLSLIHNVGQYSMGDNLPTKVYEYMLVGLPVIMTKTPYTEQFVKKYQIGVLIDPENESEICKAIAYMKANPDKAKQYGENGRKAVLKEFCWEEEANKLTELYQDVLRE